MKIEQHKSKQLSEEKKEILNSDHVRCSSAAWLSNERFTLQSGVKKSIVQLRWRPSNSLRMYKLRYSNRFLAIQNIVNSECALTVDRNAAA